MSNISLYTEEIASLLDAVRSTRPLIHQITNYVTANDCANIVLALGGSPVMADDQAEVQEMVSLASALVLNLGTLNSRTIDSMLIAGHRANGLGIPVILDPVGVGATRLRTETAQRIIAEIRLAVVRGNLSEVKTLAGLKAHTRGVDAADDEQDGTAEVARSLAERLGSVVAITGAQDIIVDGDRTVLVDNGHKMLARVTGTGCMASALVGAYCGVSDNHLKAATAALASMGLAGEKAAADASAMGVGTFKVKLFDYISCLTANQLREGARIKLG